MKIHDINPSKETVIVVIHPMLSDAASMQRFLADHLGNRYRYIIPDLSGHGQAVGQTYYSAEKEAETIHAYLLEQNITHLKLGYGASLGGVVLFQLLHYTDLSFEHIFFEGTSFYTDAKILEAVLKKVFLKKQNKAISDPAYSEKKMAAMFGEKAAGEMVKNFIHINEESLINIVHDCTNVKLPVLSEEVQKRCIFAYGEKDFDYKQAKKTLPKVYPYARLQAWKGYNHCEKLSADPLEYAHNLLQVIQ